MRHVIPALEIVMQREGETLTDYEYRLMNMVKAIADADSVSSRPTVAPAFTPAGLLCCIIQWANKKPHRGPRATVNNEE